MLFCFLVKKEILKRCNWFKIKCFVIPWRCQRCWWSAGPVAAHWVHTSSVRSAWRPSTSTPTGKAGEENHWHANITHISQNIQTFLKNKRKWLDGNVSQQTCRDFWCFPVELWLSPPLVCVQPVRSDGNFYSESVPWLKSLHHTRDGHTWRSSQQRHLDPDTIFNAIQCKTQTKEMHDSGFLVLLPLIWAYWPVWGVQSWTSGGLCKNWSSAEALPGRNQRCHDPKGPEKNK